ncbi:MAG: GNAT family N-acetyltransferase [Candidatus Bathyarchaeia archaeon]
MDFYFFIWDWKLHRDKTQILLSLDDRGVICGLLLFYEKRIVLLRGEKEAVQMLLSSLELKSVELHAPLECREIVLQKVPAPMMDETMLLLSLLKGDEKLVTSMIPQKLALDDAEEIAELVRDAFPEMLATVTADDVKTMFNEQIWYGVRIEGKLASLGSATITPEISHINWIATHEEHRNKGYATSIVSTLLKEILRTSSTAFIYVLSSNQPALKAYTRVGFKLYKQYHFIKT